MQLAVRRRGSRVVCSVLELTHVGGTEFPVRARLPRWRASFGQLPARRCGCFIVFVWLLLLLFGHSGADGFIVLRLLVLILFGLTQEETSRTFGTHHGLDFSFP